jgi:17beta-estradiol 17-dehydrogenase / very-long-chain 3-oxoacyl-CoA reductase
MSRIAMPDADTAILGILAGIGAGAVLLFLYSAAQFLSFHFITPSQPLKKYKRAGTDAYALVTGASAGIGFGIAKALVEQGFGVILLGHLEDELDAAATTLRALRPSAPSTLVRTLTMDARTATAEEMQSAVTTLTSELTITILINNVGGNPIAIPPFRPHATYSPSDVDAVINQNARFMARLTALLLPTLSAPPAAGTNERSLIVSLSSAAHIGLPWLVMYGATKAFNRAFGAGIARELASDPATAHVDSVVVTPGEVLSQGNCRGVPAGAPTAERFGRDVVRKVDGAVSRGWREMHAHWWHGVEAALAGIAPEKALTDGVTDQVAAKKEAWNGFWEKNR